MRVRITVSEPVELVVKRPNERTFEGAVATSPAGRNELTIVPQVGTTLAGKPVEHVTVAPYFKGDSFAALDQTVQAGAKPVIVIGLAYVPGFLRKRRVRFLGTIRLVSDQQ
jgi:hypothetical protein